MASGRRHDWSSCVVDISERPSQSTPPEQKDGKRDDPKTVRKRKTFSQCWAVIYKSALLKRRGSLGLFGVLEIILPILLLSCMYIPKLLLKPKEGHTVPESVSNLTEIMDIRWTQSEENYCKHLYSGGAFPTGVPRKIGYVASDSQPAEEIMHQALAYLLCKKTSSEYPLKNLTAFSEFLPDSFLSVLGLGKLGRVTAFSFIDVVLACHNLLVLEQSLSRIDSLSLPSFEELVSLSQNSSSLAETLRTFFEESNLDEILSELEWRRSDVLEAPSSACDEECLRDIDCLRPKLKGLLEKFENLNEATEYASTYPETIAAVVDFPLQPESSEELKYTIHVDARKLPDLNEKFTNWAVDSFMGMDRWKNYFSPVNIQNAIDQAVVKIFSGGTYLFHLLPYYSAYPTEAHKDPFFGWIAGLILPNIMVFAFVPAVALQIQFVVYEKNLRLDRYTAQAEMDKVLYSALSCTVTFLPYLVLAGIVSLMLSFLYPLASMSLMYVIFALWFVSLCLFTALVSLFCSSSILGSISVVVLYIAFWIPGLLVCNMMREGSTWWLIVSLCPPSSLYVFGIILSYFEQMDEGLRWEHINANIIEEADKGYLSAGSLLAVIALSSFLQGFLVFVSQSTLARRFRNSIFKGWMASRAQINEQGVHLRKDVCIEPTSGRKGAAIEFQNITKYFGRCPVVSNFSLKVFYGQLTVLLGHNGAGKTTVMSILSGVCSPTSGVLRIGGRDVTFQKDARRESLGFCQQLDFLWPTLTVSEHVILFQRFKGINCNKISQETLSMLEELGMKSRFSVQSMKLSGGEKRKLSLSLAFMGKPEIVMLDEPTAGMDSSSRRKAWQFLKGKIQSRCILLTTHLMDEAESLGDSIAIMSKGELLCYGSSIFLKGNYASGYRLLASGKYSTKNSDLATKIKTHFCDHSIPHLSSGKSTVFYLPEGCKKEISSFLESIQSDPIAHRISLSCATLNDVFLKTLRRERSSSRFQRSSKSVPNHSVKSVKERSMLHLLLWKHRLNYFRNSYRIATSLVIPVLFIAVGCLLLTILISKTSGAAIELDETYIGGPEKPLSIFSVVSPDMPTFEDADIKFDQIMLGPLTTWQSYLLQNYPTVYASCGDPKQALTCASLIFHANDSGSYNFATSNTALHGIPASLNLLNNLLLQEYMEDTTIDRVITKISPIGHIAIDAWHIVAVVMNFSSVLILLAFCCCAASFSMSPAWERMHNCKIIQTVSGTLPSQYWLAQMTFDLFLYYAFCAIMLILVYSLPSRSFFLTLDTLLGLFIILLSSGPGLITLSYIFQRLFKSDFICFGCLFALRAFLGIVFLEIGISLTVLESQGSSAASAANNALRWVFLLLPEYAIARTVYDLVESSYIGMSVDFWHFQGRSLLPNVLYLVADSILYSLVFWILESEILRWIKCRVSSSTIEPAITISQKMFRVRGLCFSYENQSVKRGLHNLSFNLYRKGVLGFIGPCGAGKSTLLKVLAGDTSGGKISRIDKSGKETPHFASKGSLTKGYCPQSGGLFPTMTIDEHIYFYSSIWLLQCKGQNTSEIMNFAAMLGLLKSGGSQTQTLSEGNKKKLSLAIALGSNCRLALLDEPSCGVDPEGQIQVCNCIRRASKIKSIVLSSHSSDECEAVCARVGILNEGKLSTLEALEDMKVRSVGDLKVNLKVNTKCKKATVKAILKKFGKCKVLLGRKAEWVQFKVRGAQNDGSRASLGSLFTQVARLLEHGVINDFNLSEMGLEDAALLLE